MKFSIAIVVFFLLFVLQAVAAEEISPTDDITATRQNVFDIENPKAVSEMTLRVVQSGFLTPQGGIKKANITLHIPQDNVQSFSVSFSPASAGVWKYVSDAFGNKVLLLEFNDMESVVEYSIESLVASKADSLYSEKSIGSNPLYLEETTSIVITPEITAAAYPFERSMKKAAELTRFVYEYMEYDISLVGERKSSTWAFENRRGVCVEHANLLAALLRAAGIPTRYVVGFAYSTVDKKMIGHTWVEILAADGSYAPFDPTWLQAGYIDATHIVTGRLLDDSQKDTLVYYGTGSLSWKRNEDYFEILDYKETPLGSIALYSEEFAVNEAGYVKAVLNINQCSIFDVKIASCTTKEGSALLDFKEVQRYLWACQPTDIYWFYESPNLENNYVYTCPVIVVEQSGAKASYDISISRTSSPPAVSISGPDTVSINEAFSLEADAQPDFIFFSPEKGVYRNNAVTESFGREGSYNFYLYSDGALAQKTVDVVKEKQFSVSVNAPVSAKVNEMINATVRIRNMLSQPVRGNIRVVFSEKVLFEGSYQFSANEEKVLLLNSSSQSAGQKKITASVFENSIASYSHVVNIVQEEKKSVIDGILEFFAGIINWFRNLL